MNAEQHEHIVKRYWDFWEQVRTDPEYSRLRAELTAMEPKYEAILATLPEQDRAVLDRYVTLRENLNCRMIEWVCESLPCRAGS